MRGQTVPFRKGITGADQIGGGGSFEHKKKKGGRPFRFSIDDDLGDGENGEELGERVTCLQPNQGEESRKRGGHPIVYIKTPRKPITSWGKRGGQKIHPAKVQEGKIVLTSLKPVLWGNPHEAKRRRTNEVIPSIPKKS